MRDGSGNKLPIDEVEKIRSIQGQPDKESAGKVSVDPNADKTPEAKKPAEKTGDKPAAGVGE